MGEHDRAISEARKRFLSARAKWRRGTIPGGDLADAAADLAVAYQNRYDWWPLSCPYGRLCARKAQEYAVLAGVYRGERTIAGL